ncbi:hypothetical protein HPDP_00575 [Candidatus Hepatincola sp. Pdp]
MQNTKMQNINKINYFNLLLPTLLFICCVILQGVINSKLLFVIAYSLLLYNFLKNKYRINIFIYFIAGIILDSNNNIILGLSTLIFLLTDLLVSIETKKFKMDFIYSYLFFFVNIIIICIFINIVQLFSNIHFINLVYFIGTAFIIYPVIYLISTIYNGFLVKQNEK